MDKSIVVVEENQRRSDSTSCASKSSGSLVHINSIAIDLTSAMEETESPAHEHFSIRGYVTGMREKDREICLPFVSEGNDGNEMDYLPPLSVPKFRWWQCADCIQDIPTETTEKAMIVAVRSDVGTSSCNNVDGEKNGLLIHSNENIGGSRDCGSEEDNVPISSIVRNSTQRLLEWHKSATLNKDKTDFRDKAPCVDIPEANPPVNIRERHNNTADAADVAYVRPTCTTDEPDNASSGSDGAKTARKRKPKLRSLADIMVENRNPTNNNSNSGTKSSSSSGMIVTTYAEAEAVLPPQLEFDSPANVMKGARSPHKKRKFVLEDERGPLGKRFRGVMLDSDKTHNRPESESESTRLDLESGAKSERIKPRKSKALDISKRARQQSHNEDGAVQMTDLPRTNDANLQKHVVSSVHSEGVFGNSRREMGPYFSSFLSGREFERVSNLSKGKRPEGGVDYDRLMPPPGRNLVGDSSSKEIPLDLSLNSFVESDGQSSSLGQRRSIPDLNETFPHQTAQENQLPILFGRSLPLNKTSDPSASCSKETSREGKRQVLASEPHNMNRNIDMSGASDDIPMEIVELLARNQRERNLGNSRKHGINTSFKPNPHVYLDPRPSMISFPQANRSGITITNGNMGPPNFPNNRQIEMGKFDESQFSFFTQRKTQYSPSSSSVTRPKANERTELLWPPRRDNTLFHLNIPQNHTFSDMGRKGKTVSDIKGREGKRGIHVGPVIKEGVVRSNSTSLDPYTNETIPAMQLLSLMDQGIVSGSNSFKVGPKSYLDKPFSPCNHHPRLNGNESQKFGPFFAQNSNPKGFSRLGYGVYCSGESSKRASSSCIQGQQVHPELGKSKVTHLAGPSDLVNRQMRSNVALGVCTLNRNPADFSVPDARNEFTISAKDLSAKKRKEKHGSVNLDGRKKPRARKYGLGKEYSRK